MHRLQQHILHQLIRHDSCRYAEIKPADIEGNLFMYHLRQVMRAGYVEKQADGRYTLSPDGHRFADGYSLETFSPRVQPRIVTLIACDNDAGQWLLLRRKRQPLLGMDGVPYGKWQRGESVAAAAQRELTEKTGLTAELHHRGDGYVTICQKGEPVSQIMFHLFYGHNPAGTLRPTSRTGTAFWGNPETLGDRVMGSVIDLIKLLETPGERFFFEQTYQMDTPARVDHQPQPASRIAGAS